MTTEYTMRGEGGRDVDLGGLIGLDKSRTSMRVLSESRANLKASSGLDFFGLHFCPFAHQDSSRFCPVTCYHGLGPEGYLLMTGRHYSEVKTFVVFIDELLRI